MNAGPLRIAVDATTWAPNRTGVGLYTERLLTAWRDLGTSDELTLYTNRFSEDPANSGLPVRGPNMPIRAVWLQTAMAAQLWRHRPDVAFFPNYLAPLVPVPGVPFVLTVHDLAVFLYPETFTFKKRVLQRAALPWLVRRAAAVLTPSESTRRDVLRLLGGRPSQVVAVPLAATDDLRIRPTPAVVAQVRAELQLPDHYVLAVGTLEPRKNIVRLVRAFEAIAAEFPDVGLVVAGGKGWRDDEIQRALGNTPVRHRLRSVGYVSPAALNVLYSEAQVLCYPSLYEGYGLPVAEAMACGTPVVTSRGSSLDEVGGDAVVAVDPLNTGAIAAALREVLASAELRTDLRGRGLARSAQFTWRKTAETTRDVFQRVVRR